MHRYAQRFADAAGLQARWPGCWWRLAATLLLILVSVPVVVGAALVANFVAVPMLLLVAIGETAQRACTPVPTHR
jgi:hypothetical protein